MANQVIVGTRPDTVRDLRDVLLAHQATSPRDAYGSPAQAGTQQAESLARDILALVQSEIDTQVEWRVRQAVEHLRAEGLGSPNSQFAEPAQPRSSGAMSVTTMVLAIPIIAIAGGIGGLPGLILALLALVAINLPWTTGWTSPQRRR